MAPVMLLEDLTKPIHFRNWTHQIYSDDETLHALGPTKNRPRTSADVRGCP